jgi:predicted nucleotidyltransferase
MNSSINVARIKAVHHDLGELRDKVVYVGGSTVSFYADRPVYEIRVTDDIDVIIEILHYNDRIGLENKLRAMGFEHDIESGIICRYKTSGVVVDIMPIDGEAIGFTNKWYRDGFNAAIDHAIDAFHRIKILTAPYFLATKLEAFKGRGQGDGRTSQDFEDIVFVLENRQTIWEELNNCDRKLEAYLIEEFTALLKHAYLYEWIDAHVERNSPPQTNLILTALSKFCQRD